VDRKSALAFLVLVKSYESINCCAIIAKANVLLLARKFWRNLTFRRKLSFLYVYVYYCNHLIFLELEKTKFYCGYSQFWYDFCLLLKDVTKVFLSCKILEESAITGF
jgi:hypothetical protein